MKLIVGLGNPGRTYADTRHNIGFTVLKALAKRCGLELKKERYIAALSARTKVRGEVVVLAIPLTFMNLSGFAVAALLKKYKPKPSDLLVVCDDLDLELGRIKLRPSGSSAGQRGLESVIDALGTSGFARLRLGIGRPPERVEAADYVLSAFKPGEKEPAAEMIKKALDCALSWVSYGTARTMNNFNKRSKDE